MKEMFFAIVLTWPLVSWGDPLAQLEAGFRNIDPTTLSKYRAQAEQGVPSIQFALGLMYQNGWGVPQDYVHAVRWYRRSAWQGDELAQISLAVMYSNGWGVAQDYVTSYAWLSVAAAGGSRAALETQARFRRGMSRAKIAEAQELSLAIAQRIRREQPPITTAPQRPPTLPAPHVLNAPKQRPTPSPSSALVRKVQTRLETLGYHPGPIDGLVGPKTVAAVRFFQNAMGVSTTGHISEELLVLLDIAVAARSVKTGSRKSKQATLVRSGSGFVVTAEGHVVTNYHVINTCSWVTVSDRQKVEIVATDKSDDLALLKATGGYRKIAVLEESRTVTLGESVTVAGFPLKGLLAQDLNVTTGTVSALRGLGGDARFSQITAPVQVGNSGGPMFNKSGNIIGVVIAKLNAVQTYKVTGDFPQNVNFAIKGAIVRAFLDIHGVNYRMSSSTVDIGTERVASRAKAFTVQVGCWR